MLVSLEVIQGWWSHARQRVLLWAWLVGVSKCFERTRYDSSSKILLLLTFLSVVEKITPNKASANSRWAVLLRHAANDNAFKPSLMMGARGWSAVDILVLAPGTRSSVGSVLDNHYVQPHVEGRKCSNRNTSSYVSGIRTRTAAV